MTPQEFIQAVAEAFGTKTQLPIAFGYSDEPLTEPTGEGASFKAVFSEMNFSK